MATLEIINIGTSPNDGSGDPLRTAFNKVNNNFANLWSTGFNTTESLTNGNTTQIIWQYPANIFTQATFQINSSADESTDNQNIVINASINGNSSNIRFTGHSTTFHGNAVCNYEMDVVSGNVILYADPFVTGGMTHFIAYQVTFNPLIMGTPLALEQDANTVLITENSASTINTEN